MTLPEAAAIFAAACAAGTINSVAGGGTLLTFPVLLWAGRDPIVANATNALALWPGSFASAFAFRRELAATRPLLRLLLPASFVGALLGGFLLLRTSSATFSLIVPFLILAATALLAAQRVVARVLRDAPVAPRGGRHAAVLTLAQAVVATHGGYFGAGMGILMLAALGLYGVADIHQRNGLKNVLAAVINGAASVYFAASGAIAWGDAAVLAAGSVLGGYVGASVGRRLPRAVVEAIVITVGVVTTAVLFHRQLR